MQSVALMERQGIPIDTETLGLLRENWDLIRSQLIDRIDVAGVYTEGSFSEQRFEQYLAANGVPWPRLQSGRLALDEDTFRQQARSHSRFIAKYHELRSALSKLKLNSLGAMMKFATQCSHCLLKYKQQRLLVHLQLKLHVDRWFLL